MRTPNAQLGEVPQASKWQTQAHVGRRSRARKQVTWGFTGDTHWAYWHMATPLLGASRGYYSTASTDVAAKVEFVHMLQVFVLASAALLDD
jgi:hypothetical protein